MLTKNVQQHNQIKHNTKYVDRFIQNRSNLDVNMSNFNLFNSSENNPFEMINDNTLPNLIYQSKIKSSLMLNDSKNILQLHPELDTTIRFGQDMLCSTERNFKNNIINSPLNDPRSILFYQNVRGLQLEPYQYKNSPRNFPLQSLKTIDLGEIIISEDFYSTVLDWNIHNKIILAIGCEIRIYDAYSDKYNILNQMTPNIIKSLKTSRYGSKLAVGSLSRHLNVWDINHSTMIYKKNILTPAHSISWKDADGDNIFSIGKENGSVVNYDLRTKCGFYSKYTDHTHKVCGLKWSANGILLASGSKDNTVNIYDIRAEKLLYRFTSHRSAVKAIDWCPYRSNLLVTGGCDDHTIKIWDCSNGSCKKTIEGSGEITGVYWSRSYKEILAVENDYNNSISVWKSSGLIRVGTIEEEMEVLLHTAISPCNTTLVTTGADNKLVFYKIWPEKPVENDHSLYRKPKSFMKAKGKKKPSINCIR